MAVLSVSQHAIKGLLSALLGFFHELVLLALLAGLDVGGGFVLGKERSWDGRLILALHRGVAKLGDGRLLLILLVADDVRASGVDHHLVHLGDDRHGVGGDIGGNFGAGASRANGIDNRFLGLSLSLARFLCLGHLLLESLFELLSRHEAELVLLVFELAIEDGFLHLEALELLLLRWPVRGKS